MTDRDIEREIEENHRRARPESEVGLEEDEILDRESEDSGTIVDRLGNAIFGKDRPSREREVEYDDEGDEGKFIPD